MPPSCIAHLKARATNGPASRDPVVSITERVVYNVPILAGSTSALTRDLAKVLNPEPMVYSTRPSTMKSIVGANANATNDVDNSHRLKLDRCRSLVCADQPRRLRRYKSSAGNISKNRTSCAPARKESRKLALASVNDCSGTPTP